MDFVVYRMKYRDKFQRESKHPPVATGMPASFDGEETMRFSIAQGIKMQNPDGNANYGVARADIQQRYKTWQMSDLLEAHWPTIRSDAA